MAPQQYYHKVGDEGEGLISEKGAELRAPPESTPWWKKSVIVTLAIIIAILTAMLAALGSMVVKQTDVSAAAASATSTASAEIEKAQVESNKETQIVANPSTLSNVSLEILDCGSNPGEARAKGCIFDVMMQLWTPAPCFDEVLSERYLAMGNWTWWSSPEADHELSLDEMKKGEHTVIFVIQDYHKSHCIYAWEKLVRTLRNEGPLIEELISYDHVIHCRHKTLQRADGENAVQGVRAPTGYTKCGHYEAWKGHLPSNEHSSVDK